MEDRSIEPIVYEGTSFSFHMTPLSELLISSSPSGSVSLGGCEHIPEDMLLGVTSRETILVKSDR